METDSDDLTTFQELLTEAYEVYRQLTKKRKPSDAAWSKYLGIKPSAFNHWINDNRKPNLISVLQLSKGLAKLDRYLKIDDVDSMFRWRVFDSLKMPRIHVAPNSKVEYLGDNWDIMPDDLINKVIDIIDVNERRKKHKGGRGNGNDEESQGGSEDRDIHFNGDVK